MRDRFAHFRARAAGGDAGKVNVTPMIDVIMVLIVFYLIVGRLAVDRSAQVQLPATAAGTVDATRGLTLSVLPKEGGGISVVMADTEVSLDTLPDLLRASIPSLSGSDMPGPTQLHLRADRRLSYGEVSPVIEACRKAGVGTVRLVASREGTP